MISMLICFNIYKVSKSYFNPLEITYFMPVNNKGAVPSKSLL